MFESFDRVVASEFKDLVERGVSERLVCDAEKGFDGSRWGVEGWSRDLEFSMRSYVQRLRFLEVVEGGVCIDGVSSFCCRDQVVSGSVDSRSCCFDK